MTCLPVPLLPVTHITQVYLQELQQEREMEAAMEAEAAADAAAEAEAAAAAAAAATSSSSEGQQQGEGSEGYDVADSWDDAALMKRIRALREAERGQVRQQGGGRCNLGHLSCVVLCCAVM